MNIQRIPEYTRHDSSLRVPNFRGELEVRFFDAVRKGDKNASLRLLNNIKFDVFERDAVTGNNFLHVVCKEGSEDFFSRALKLLKLNVSRIAEIIGVLNKDNKKPLDYTSDNDFITKVYALAGLTGAGTAGAAAKSASAETTSAKPAEKEELVGNEITEEIDLDGFDFGTEPAQTETKTYSDRGMEGIVGLSRLKEVFGEEIINPLNNGKNVFTNGFLLHGFSGNGKTYSVEKLAEELNREIMDSGEFIRSVERIEKAGKGSADGKISELIDSVIIKINPDDIREIAGISNILKSNNKSTHKQGIVFIDEIQKFFPAENQYINNISAIQAIENSAKNGMVLLATTRELDSIDPTLINSLRFERLIENKPPMRSEIREIIDRKFTGKLGADELERLSKSMTGFSYNDIVKILEKVEYEGLEPTFGNISGEIVRYAKEHSITSLTEEGTTGNYDSYLKRVEFSENDPKNLDDVIGMKEVKEKLRKVFGPVKNEKLLADYYRANKIKKPNGILLYGPPGCGKTYIMTALSAETKLPMYQLKISEVGSSLYNQTTKNIKKVFDQLRKKYKETGEASILFFDECDSLFAKNPSELNLQILNTLKEEMNNAGDDGIYIVAATNEKDNINPAIIRDGRFDTKIEVGYPDAEARRGLIKRALSVPMFAGSNFEEYIEELVALTNGLSNATITNIFSTLKYEKGAALAEKAVSKEKLDELIRENPIKYSDLKNSIQAKKEEINKINLKQRKNPMMEWQGRTAIYDEYKERTYYTENDPKNLNDVIGMEKVKEQFKLKVLGPLNPIIREMYKKQKLPLASGIILHGPGGVGKTFIVKAAAAESKIPLYEMKISEMGSKYMNETANNIQNVFNQLKRKYRETGEPSILFLDECDSLLASVNNEGSSASQDRMAVMNTLKAELAEAPNNGIVVIAATNEYENLDKNVIRSGRFNDHIKIGYPDIEARTAYIRHLLKKRPITEKLCEKEENIKELASLTDGFSNADIQSIVENAVIKAQAGIVDAAIKAVSQGDMSLLKDDNTPVVEISDIKNAIEEKRSEVGTMRGEYDY